ncbi:hypothetical protein ACN47E_008100 [Coniothyrium glycines]
MPRRPVKPQDRQRIARACDACKASKKRCDGCRPCRSCDKKGHHDTCHYTPGRRHHPLPPHNSLPNRVPAMRPPQTQSNNHIIANDIGAPDSSLDTCHIHPDSIGTNYDDALRQHGTADVLDNTTSETSSETLVQPPVMLSSVSGDNVFIGNTAAISFLRFLQKTLERHVGPSCFTHGQGSQRLFEAYTSTTGSSRFYDGLGLEDRLIFAQGCLDASSGLLDLYVWDEVSQMFNAHHENHSGPGPGVAPQLSSLEVVSLYLMVAIGAQCCGQSPDHVAWAAELFSYARKLALEQMLENPSLQLIRAFLLMAFYMFGACRRNSAFMYLGVASKAADILGLHVSAQYKHLPPAARNTRLRTAKSLRVFDVVCSSILGRPSNTPLLRPGYTNYLEDDCRVGSEVVYRALALGATYELAIILDAVVSKSAAGNLDEEAAEQVVRSLQQQSRNFPAALRRSNNDENMTTRYTIIGNMHVSGAYYFSVILATRHFLIQHMIPRLSEQTRTSAGRKVSHQDRAADDIIDRLANACTEAATFMAQMCYHIVESGHMLANMCIVKAWIFATGLVLGFSLLGEDSNPSSDRRTAFLKSLHVLGLLKLHSPQAEQYYGILSHFHAAIKAYKEKLYRGRNMCEDSLVDRVFLPDMTLNFDGLGSSMPQLPSPDLTVTDSAPPDWRNELPLDVNDDTVPFDPMIFGENDIIMQMLWESDRYAIQFPECALPDEEVNLDPSIPL